MYKKDYTLSLKQNYIKYLVKFWSFFVYLINKIYKYFIPNCSLYKISVDMFFSIFFIFKDIEVME